MTNEEIVRFHARDPDLIRALHNQCQRPLAQCVRRFIDDPDDQKDALQDSWVQALEKRHQYQGKGSFEGWVLQIARRVCLMRLRRAAALHRARFVRESACDAEPECQSEHESIRHALLVEALEEAVRDAVRTLSPREQDIIRRFRWEGQAIAQIAADLHVRPGTVKATLHHARLHLYAALYEIHCEADPSVFDLGDSPDVSAGIGIPETRAPVPSTALRTGSAA